MCASSALTGAWARYASVLQLFCQPPVLASVFKSASSLVFCLAIDNTPQLRSAGTRRRTSESQRPPSSSACVKKRAAEPPQPLQSTWSASRPRDASDARLCEDCAAGRPAAL